MHSVKQPFIFVLMPFDCAFDDIYKVGIKQACKNVGGYCERVDEQIYDGDIVKRIYNQINKADIIIADLTGKNANVFYETGFAHALEKKVILLTQNVEDIPFDLVHYPHIIYGGKIFKLVDELERKLRWFIENPESNQEDDSLIELYINQSLIPEGDGPTKAFTCYLNESVIDQYVFSLSLSLFNPSMQFKTSMGGWIQELVTPSIFKPYSSSFKDEPFDIPGGLTVARIFEIYPLKPRQWQGATISIKVNLPKEDFGEGIYDFTIYIRNNIDEYKYPFQIHFVFLEEDELLFDEQESY